MAYKNKADQYASQKRWYETHRQAQVERVRKNNGRYRKDRRAIIDQAKDKPCADCGSIFPPYVMDFDHMRGSKKVANIASMTGWSIEAIKKEIDKCDVVCSNCHRIRTHCGIAKTAKALVS